ncbi:MAG: hypothetical protein ABTR20_13650 [Candidatus Competibacter sp.]
MVLTWNTVTTVVSPPSGGTLTCTLGDVDVDVDGATFNYICTAAANPGYAFNSFSNDSGCTAVQKVCNINGVKATPTPLPIKPSLLILPPPAAPRRFPSARPGAGRPLFTAGPAAAPLPAATLSLSPAPAWLPRSGVGARFLGSSPTDAGRWSGATAFPRRGAWE